MTRSAQIEMIQMETCNGLRPTDLRIMRLTLIDDGDSSAMLSEALFNSMTKSPNDVAKEIVRSRKYDSHMSMHLGHQRRSRRN